MNGGGGPDLIDGFDQILYKKKAMRMLGRIILDARVEYSDENEVGNGIGFE